MSALPKKKLCWNCDGNVSTELDNCPYCAVYLHVEDTEEHSFWKPHTNKEIESDDVRPIYSPKEEKNSVIEPISEESETSPPFFPIFWSRCKKDILPLVTLLSGSIFFLFSLILFLFARHETLTLQWNGEHWIYFCMFSLPLLYMGWQLLQQTDTE